MRPRQHIVWTTECQRAFEDLKAQFESSPVLQHPNQQTQFIIQTDASDVAGGAVLLQLNKQGQLQPCAYTSKKFRATERRWAILEKEAFAVWWALLTWCHILEGTKTKFEVWTDHLNLIALQTPIKLLPKQVCWAEYFQRFNFVLKYIPAGKKFLADALSHMPQFNSKRDDIVQASIPGGQQDDTVAQNADTVSGWGVTLQEALWKDPWLRNNLQLFTQKDGLTWKGYRLYIPGQLREAVMQRCHNAKTAGHFRFLKTLHLIRCQFWWPHM